MRGFVLIAFGILYLMKPDLFRNGIWTKRSMLANKTPEEYRNFMKKLAIVLIVLGTLLLTYDYTYLFSEKPIPESLVSR